MSCPGHVVSTNGVETDPEKLETLTSWAEPKKVKELRSSLVSMSIIGVSSKNTPKSRNA